MTENTGGLKALMDALASSRSAAKTVAPQAETGLDTETDLVLPSEQEIYEKEIVWTWKTLGGQGISIILALDLNSGEWATRLANVETLDCEIASATPSLSDIGSIAKAMASAAEWPKVWKHFVADLLLQTARIGAVTGKPQADEL